MKAAVLLVALLLLQQPGASSTVEGVVVKSGTSEPLAKAVVELRRAEDGATPGREPQIVTTGADATTPSNSRVAASSCPVANAAVPSLCCSDR